MELIKRLNKYLVNTYGMSLDNKPKFRIAWTGDLFEVRKALHSPLAIYETVERVPKYSNLQDRWVLEVYVRAFPDTFGRAIQHAQMTVLDTDGYEILRAFQTKTGEMLHPRFDVCKIICDAFIELINRPPARRLTEKQDLANEMREVDAEQEKFFELLNADDSDLINKFHDKEAVILPGKVF